MKTIYFVRHGETESNVVIRTGRPEDPLSEQGLKQAELVAQRFKSIPIQALISSPFARAQQTAQAIAQLKQLPIIPNDLFSEVHSPSILAGTLYTDPRFLQLRRDRTKNWGNPAWRHSDEENFFDAFSRAQKALQFLDEQKEEIIAVTTHGGFMRMLAGTMIFGKLFTAELSNAIYGSLGVSNTGVTVVQHQHKDHWLIIRWNDTVHLEPDTNLF